MYKSCITHYPTVLEQLHGIKDTSLEDPSIESIANSMNDESYLLQFDGAAVPNPGRASGGAVLFSPRRGEIFEPDAVKYIEVGEYIPHATNNVAEYTGLIIGLELALEEGVRRIIVEGDSMLVVQQVQGKWKVSAEPLKPYCARAKELLGKFESVVVRHIRREKNAHADALTNEVVAKRAGFRRGSFM